MSDIIFWMLLAQVQVFSLPFFVSQGSIISPWGLAVFLICLVAPYDARREKMNRRGEGKKTFTDLSQD